MRRLLKVTLAAMAAVLALTAGGCLKDHPLVLPENGYDPAVALRNDSLARFDTVEILLVDSADPSRAIRIFKGPIEDADGLEPHAAGDGRKLVYIVKGLKSDRGYCYAEQVTREGAVKVLVDTCPKPVVEDKPKPEPEKPVPPEFPDQAISAVADSVAVRVLFHSDTASAALTLLPFSNPEAVQWVPNAPYLFKPGKGEHTVVLRVIRNFSMPGDYTAGIVTGLSGQGSSDTLLVKVHIDRIPAGHVFGKVVDWRDSLPQAGWTVELQGESATQVTKADGLFDFGTRKPGVQVLTLSAEGRIGRRDTLFLADSSDQPFTLATALPNAFKEVAFSWQRQPGRVAIAAGHGLVPTSELGVKGALAVFPLDNPSLSLQRFPDQANWDPEDPDEYFESGEMAADSSLACLVYPEDDWLGCIRDWRGTAVRSGLGLPFKPFSVLIDDTTLLVTGRNSGGTLLLAQVDAPTLKLRRVDTLQGQAWDGVLALEQGPRLVSTPLGLFATDGNAPVSKGRVLKIGANGKVAASAELPLAGAADLAYCNGLIYVAVSAFESKSVKVFNMDLTPASFPDIATGKPSTRIVFAQEGRLAGLGFVAVEDNAVLVIKADEFRVVGRLPVPGSARIRSLAVDGVSGKVLATDGLDKVYEAEF